jgi:ABC-type multidrug transport system fused ATPase/permease subunit
MTFPTNTPRSGQTPAQTAAGSVQAVEQTVTAPIPPDQIDFSRLMEEQFQLALAEDEEERAQQRRLRLYIIIGIAAAVLILAFAVVATIFGWWPVVLDIVLIVVVLINGVMLMFLGRAVLEFIRTIREMRAEITPVIASLADTATTAQETAKTATSRFGIGPVVRTATLLLSAVGVARTMLGPRRTPTRAEARQQRREEVDQQIAARMEQSTGQAQSRRQTT